jgi:hypothetical protein
LNRGGTLSPPLNLYTLSSLNSMNRFEVRYQRPYSNGWYSQFFATIEEAERMVNFYISCGSPATLIRN